MSLPGDMATSREGSVSLASRHVSESMVSRVPRASSSLCTTCDWPSTWHNPQNTLAKADSELLSQEKHLLCKTTFDALRDRVAGPPVKLPGFRERLLRVLKCQDGYACRLAIIKVLRKGKCPQRKAVVIFIVRRKFAQQGELAVTHTWTRRPPSLSLRATTSTWLFPRNTRKLCGPRLETFTVYLRPAHAEQHVGLSSLNIFVSRGSLL